MAEVGRDFVTVVSGLPRSGTSLVMQMLGAGGLSLLVDGSRAADEHNPRGYFEYAPVRSIERDASFVKQAIGRAVKVVHPLVRHLPSDLTYRVVWLRRSVAGMAASQAAMLGEAPPEAVLLSRALRRLETWCEVTPHVEALRVSFDDLLRDPTPRAAAIARFLGGGLDLGAMAGVVDPRLRHFEG